MPGMKDGTVSLAAGCQQCVESPILAWGPWELHPEVRVEMPVVYLGCVPKEHSGGAENWGSQYKNQCTVILWVTRQSLEKVIQMCLLEGPGSWAPARRPIFSHWIVLQGVTTCQHLPQTQAATSGAVSLGEAERIRGATPDFSTCINLNSRAKAS